MGTTIFHKTYEMSRRFRNGPLFEFKENLVKVFVADQHAHDVDLLQFHLGESGEKLGQLCKPKLQGFTFWLFNIAMGNGPFIDGLPIKNGDFAWLC
jgi:hypothetical protein